MGNWAFLPRASWEMRNQSLPLSCHAARLEACLLAAKREVAFLWTQGTEAPPLGPGGASLGQELLHLREVAGAPLAFLVDRIIGAWGCAVCGGVGGGVVLLLGPPAPY